MSIIKIITTQAMAPTQAIPQVEVKLNTVARLLDWAIEVAVKYSFQALGGLVIIFAAWIISKYVSKLVFNKLSERKVDPTIVRFLSQLTGLMIMVVGLLMMLGSFGVQIAPLIAGLSVAGVGIGLAIQGPLSNYAAGATLIFTKPFKLGDIIEVNGFQGEVKDIALPRTELDGLDGSRIIIPNKHIIGEVIKNYSQLRKLEVNIGVSYDSDLKKVIQVLEDIIKKEERIPNHEIYKVGIKEFADSSINLQAFVWVPQEKYTDAKFAINIEIFEQFRKNNISIPFPQRDIRIIETKQV
jgi:small conductance mechanosensitive channel